MSPWSPEVPASLLRKPEARRLVLSEHCYISDKKGLVHNPLLSRLIWSPGPSSVHLSPRPLGSRLDIENLVVFSFDQGVCGILP